ncbi:hypothetical protein [Coleofasciculus chthonoplastes]
MKFEESQTVQPLLTPGGDTVGEGSVTGDGSTGDGAIAGDSSITGTG